MLPGITSKLSESLVASATSIVVKTDLVQVTGTTTIVTIIDQFGGGFSGVLFMYPTDGAVPLNTGGNIAKALTMAQNQLTVLVFSKKNQLWYPGAIS